MHIPPVKYSIIGNPLCVFLFYSSSKRTQLIADQFRAVHILCATCGAIIIIININCVFGQ